MGCINGKHRTKNTNAEDTAPINIDNPNSTANDNRSDFNQQQTSTSGVVKNKPSKQTDKQKNSKKDHQNNKKRKKKKDADIKIEESSLSSPSNSTSGGGVLRRNAQNGFVSSRYSNPANNEDTFEINNDIAGSNTLPNYFNVTPDRLHKNFQDRLVGTQMSRGGQKLSDSQLEFFKMLDEKIAQGGEPDDTI